MCGKWYEYRNSKEGVRTLYEPIGVRMMKECETLKRTIFKRQTLGEIVALSEPVGSRWMSGETEEGNSGFKMIYFKGTADGRTG
jgi:hypothetical protein